MKKPLSITSPNHSWALVCYFMLGAGGFGYVVNKTSTIAGLMVREHGALTTDIWAISLMVFGFCAFGSAATAKLSPRPEHHLWVEMWCCVVLALDLAFLVSLLAKELGLVSISFVLPFFLGAAFRALQIFLEQRLLKRARLHPMKSDSVLADPREEHGQ